MLNWITDPPELVVPLTISDGNPSHPVKVWPGWACASIVTNSSSSYVALVGDAATVPLDAGLAFSASVYWIGSSITTTVCQLPQATVISLRNSWTRTGVVRVS